MENTNRYERYTQYGGVRAPQVTTSARIERLKRETAKESDLVIAICLGGLSIGHKEYEPNQNI